MRLEKLRVMTAIMGVTAAASSAAMSGCRTRAHENVARDSTHPSTRVDSVVLRTDKTQYRAGERMTLTFENRSASSYAFNPCTRTLEREENGAWTAVPEPGRMCTMEAWILDARGTRSGPTELPSPLAAGRYRVVVRMTVERPDAAPAAAISAVSEPITVT